MHPAVLLLASNSQGVLPTIEPSRLRVDEINWKWRNQRQIRKARRRKHAAGARNAFA